MEQQANYIRRIEIHGLWERFNIGWDLRPDVNILSGINGVGKTTILNRSVGYLEELSGEMKSDEKNGVRLFFDNPQATYIPYDVIRSYDRPLIMGDFTARMADKNVKSELDWQLYLLQRRYLDYQVNIGNKMIEMLSSIDEEERCKAATLSVAKRRFQDMRRRSAGRKLSGRYTENTKENGTKSGKLILMICCCCAETCS